MAPISFSTVSSAVLQYHTGHLMQATGHAHRGAEGLQAKDKLFPTSRTCCPHLPAAFCHRIDCFWLTLELESLGYLAKPKAYVMKRDMALPGV